MRTVTFSVGDFAKTKRRALAALRGDRQGAHIAFATPGLLSRLMTENRWTLLRTLAGKEAITLRELARELGRDVKAVHGDAHALLNAGVLQKTDDGRLLFPFDAVHVDFVVQVA